MSTVESDLKGVIFGIGNPLLDISAHVPQAVLEKYELKPSNACLAEPKHLPLYEELVRDYQVEYIAGGATQNSIRAAQWMIQRPGATVYLGCIGNDKFGVQLTKAARADGVDVHYLTDAAAPTGTCAVLIVDRERSLCANLGAANNYKLEHLLEEEQQALMRQARVYYMAGFFLTVCPPAALHVAQHAAEHNKVFAINLAAPFIIQFFTKPLDDVMAYADFVFGNEHEAEALGTTKQWGTDLEEIAKQASALPKVNAARPRIVVFTQGAKDTLVCIEGKITYYPVPAIASAEIVDTNGAGDSFVGGFLAYHARGATIEQCCAAGAYCAGEVIRRNGATYPEYTPKFHL